MKKAISFMLATVMSVSLLSVCFGSNAQAAKKNPVTITITYATGNELSANTIHERIVDFMAENPNVKVVEKLSNEGAYLDSIKTLDAVGEFPDVIEMRDTALYVRAEKIGELPSDIMDMFNSPVDYNGKYYTAPLDEMYPIGIIYNKKLFDKLKIDVSKIKVYDDFLDICQTVKDAGTAPIVVGASDIWHIGFWWSYFWNNNVANTNPNFLADRYAGDVSFTDENVAKAMNGLNDLFQKGYVEAGWASTAESQCVSVLISEKAAMYLTGPFTFNAITEADPDFEFGFFAIPDENGKYNVTGGATNNGWAINAETQANDPDKTEAVYDFIKYFFREDNYTDYCEINSSFPSIEGIVYEATEQMQTALDIAANADDRQLMWNGKMGNNEMPPNFRNFCYKLTNEWFLNMSTVEDGLVTMDKEWANCTKDFNPVLGIR